MRNVLYPAGSAILAGLCLIGLPASAQLKTAISEGEKATRKAENIQEQINQLDDKRKDLEGEYRSMLQRLDSAKLYNAQQQGVVESQREELAALEEQLGRVDEITAQMAPMLDQMIKDLKAFVARDLPFKMADRQARLDQLDAVMTDPDVAPAERYRLIVAAYQAEMEYGRTIATFQEEIDGVSVDMFQYGRVALVYYNPANGEVARFDREEKKWEKLPSSYRRPIQVAIRIAEGTKQKDILLGPVEKFDAEKNQ